MKDWRGVIVVLALSAMIFALAMVDASLRVPCFTALATLLGAMSQRSKLDALVQQIGQSIPPGATSISERKILVPPLPKPTNLGGQSMAPPPDEEKHE